MPETLKIPYDLDVTQRLDSFLAGLNHPRMHSRTFIEKLLSEGLVEVNGKLARKSYRLSKNDQISLIMPEPQPSDITPQQIPLEIIFEDEYLAVINKPAELVVHPGHGNPDKTLANAIAYRYSNSLKPNESNLRPGIVHRLDKGTSGLIIVARNEAVQAKLADMFARRKVVKTYLAITVGIPDPASDMIETFISRNPSQPRKMMVSSTGRLARTSYEVMRYYEGFALLKVNLGTGRMHQIRVQLTARHTPVLGDALYGSVTDTLQRVPQNLKKKTGELLSNHLKRQALHAWKLELVHPITGMDLAFTAPVPQDIIYTLDWLEKYFSIDNDCYDKKLFE